MTGRVRRTFWALLAVAAVAAGALSRALGVPPGPAAGAAVAVSGLVLAVAGALALRILVVVGRAGLPPADRRPHPGGRTVQARSPEQS